MYTSSDDFGTKRWFPRDHLFRGWMYEGGYIRLGKVVLFLNDEQFLVAFCNYLLN